MDKAILEFMVVMMLVFVRMLPLALVLPRVFSCSAPRRYSLGLAVVISLAAASEHALSAALAQQLTAWTLILAVLRELVLGLAMALGFAILLAAFHLVGAILGQLSGAHVADIADVQGSFLGETAVGRYFGWLALSVFLVSGGHRQMVGAILDSYAWIPPGGPLPVVSTAPLLGQLLGGCFHAGMRAAAPVAFCLIVSTVLVAVLARTMPSIGAFGLGVTVNLVVLLLVTCLWIEAATTVYQQTWSSGLDRMLDTLLSPGGSGHE
jgi:flagellar biosynthetic protein FliR